MAREATRTRCRIVVVDDEKDMREFLDIMLRKEGYEVVCMPSADPALRWCRENRFDLVITDLKMPGIDGVELLKAVKGLDPDVIQSKEEGASNAVPNTERKDPVEAVDTLLPPLFVCVDYYLRVGLRLEYMSRSKKLFAQLNIIINLSIENNLQSSIFVTNRLVTTLQIDNTEPTMT